MKLSELPFVKSSPTEGILDLWDVPAGGIPNEIPSVTGRRYADLLMTYARETDSPIILGQVVRDMISKKITFGPVEAAFFHRITFLAS